MGKKTNKQPLKFVVTIITNYTLKVPNEENYYLNDILRSKEFKDFSKKYGVSRENILNFYATNKAFVMELQKERTITFENRKEPDSPAMNEGSQKKEDGGEKNG